MTSLTVWAFKGADDAAIALKRIESHAKESLMQLQDAAIVSWPEGAKRPKTQQLHSMVGVGSLGGAFWGMLFGLIFLVPILGAAIGAGIGAMTGAFADIGIDDNFIKRVRAQIEPGTSALFVLADQVVLEKVSDVFEGLDVELIQTNLTSEQEAALEREFHLV
jgi:uncharacterized membrane protein